MSVTEEEVHRGLLYMDNRDQKAFFYRRKIIDLEKNFQDKSAGKFIDKKVTDTFSDLVSDGGRSGIQSIQPQIR